MPFLIKTRRLEEYSTRDDYDYFFVDILRSIPQQRFFSYKPLRIKKEIVISKRDDEAATFETLLDAQHTVRVLTEINRHYPYLIVEIKSDEEVKSE